MAAARGLAVDAGQRQPETADGAGGAERVRHVARQVDEPARRWLDARSRPDLVRALYPDPADLDIGDDPEPLDTDVEEDPEPFETEVGTDPASLEPSRVPLPVAPDPAVGAVANPPEPASVVAAEPP